MVVTRAVVTFDGEDVWSEVAGDDDVKGSNVPESVVEDVVSSTVLLTVESFVG